MCASGPPVVFSVFQRRSIPAIFFTSLPNVSSDPGASLCVLQRRGTVYGHHSGIANRTELLHTVLVVVGYFGSWKLEAVSRSAARLRDAAGHRVGAAWSQVHVGMNGGGGLCTSLGPPPQRARRFGTPVVGLQYDQQYCEYNDDPNDYDCNHGPRALDENVLFGLRSGRRLGGVGGFHL